MRVIYKDSKQTVEKEYPNKDITKPIIGLNEIKVSGQKQPVQEKDKIEYYFINEIIPVNENPNKFDLIQMPDKLTDKQHEVLTHLKICDRVWELVPKSQTGVLNNLNSTFGAWIDKQYLPQTRTKHILQSFNANLAEDKKAKIKELQEWLLKCYDEKEKREIDYINSGIFPDFGNWPEKQIIKTLKK